MESGARPLDPGELSAVGKCDFMPLVPRKSNMFA